MPLLEWARVEVYVPDLPVPHYRNYFCRFNKNSHTHLAGAQLCAALRAAISLTGINTPDRVSLIYTDLPFALSTGFENVARYSEELKQAAFEALAEETILVTVEQIYHAV